MHTCRRLYAPLASTDGGAGLVAPAIKGIQKEKVIANAKHWVNNNQETDRTTVSEEVDERTQFEMYYVVLPAVRFSDRGERRLVHVLIQQDSRAKGMRKSPNAATRSEGRAWLQGLGHARLVRPPPSLPGVQRTQ